MVVRKTVGYIRGMEAEKLYPVNISERHPCEDKDPILPLSLFHFFCITFSYYYVSRTGIC